MCAFRRGHDQVNFVDVREYLGTGCIMETRPNYVSLCARKIVFIRLGGEVPCVDSAHHLDARALCPPTAAPSAAEEIDTLDPHASP